MIRFCVVFQSTASLSIRGWLKIGCNLLLQPTSNLAHNQNSTTAYLWFGFGQES